MKSERDTTRIVQSWLEVGSTGIPDRVLDAVVAELPSRPQRRSMWSPWRSLQMKPIIPAVAGAAVIFLAVVLGMQFLRNGSSVGVATSTPTPPSTPTVIGGQFTFAGDITVDMDATSDGSTLSGTVVGVFNGETLRITLQCLRQFDADTWMFAGVLTQSADPKDADGSWASLIVRDGSPQQAGIWIEAQATAEDCEEFVRDVPDRAVEGFEMIGPMNEGRITLPPDPSPSAVTGQFVLFADRDYTLVFDAFANGSTLSGTVAVSFEGGGTTIGLQCARQFDPQTWMLAGEIEESSGEGLPIGTRIAVIVRDGSPQQASMWPANGPADDCADFVRNIPDNAVEGQDMIGPVEGAITLPPAP